VWMYKLFFREFNCKAKTTKVIFSNKFKKNCESLVIRGYMGNISIFANEKITVLLKTYPCSC
jgi:hypothetical protein